MSLQSNWTCLHTEVFKTIKKLEKQNIWAAEAFYTSTQITEVSVRNSEILTRTKGFDSGVGFRVVLPRGKVGFACTNNMDSVENAGKEACKNARVASEIPHFTLPQPRFKSKAEGLYDPEIAGISVEEAVDAAARAIKSGEEYDRRVTVKSGRVVFWISRRGVINTLGLNHEEKETRAVLYIGGVGKQGGEVTGECYDFTWQRTADLKPEEIGENVGRMVVKMFNPRPVTTFQGTVVFSSNAVSNQLASVLVDALRGENIVSNRSNWKGKLSQQVASNLLTVEDNALLKRGFGSRSFDDEGFPSQQTLLLRKGELSSFLHHATSANSLQTENTGNASRTSGGVHLDIVRMIIGNGYRTKPHISPSNLVIKPGKKTKQQLLSEVAKGVLVESMAGFPQAGSGVVSVQLSRAFYVEKGEIKHTIRSGMISGVAFDWFNKISGVSSDYKQFSNVVVPSLRVEDVKIIGS